jgi:hypothetical protein
MYLNLFDLIELQVTFGLVVLIWMVQVLLYPSFIYYKDATFTDVMTRHQNRITYIVLPLMVIELTIACVKLLNDRSLLNLSLLILVLLIWISTFFIQVPLHKRLLYGKDESVLTALIKTNWFRTGIWSLKLLIIFCASVHTL